MNLSNYIRPWLSYMVARLVEITTPEVLGVPGDYTGRAIRCESSLRSGFYASIPNAAPSQTQTTSQ